MSFIASNSIRSQPEWRRIGEGGFNDWTASYDLPTDLDGLVWWILKKKVVEKVGALLDYHIHLKIFDETQIIYSPTNPDRGQTRGWRINLMMLPWLAMKYKKNNWNLKLGNCILLSVKYGVDLILPRQDSGNSIICGHNRHLISLPSSDLWLSAVDSAIYFLFFSFFLQIATSITIVESFFCFFLKQYFVFQFYFIYIFSFTIISAIDGHLVNLQLQICFTFSERSQNISMVSIWLFIKIGEPDKSRSLIYQNSKNG